jgi:class 3 adenylate cyclase
MEQPTRRLSAVWFADIVGYSELSSRDEPAALRLVESLQAAARAIIEEFEGRIVKFIGDAVLAEFASTQSAVRAAVALQERYAQDARRQGIDSALRIAVHLGEVTATPDGDLYGDGINTAARLQHEAAPGQIVASEDVWRQLRQRPEFRFEALGAVELRGITTRMTIYDVLFGARAALARPPEGRPAVVSPPRAGPPATSASVQRRWGVATLSVLVAVAVGAITYALLFRDKGPGSPAISGIDRGTANPPAAPPAAPPAGQATAPTVSHPNPAPSPAVPDEAASAPRLPTKPLAPASGPESARAGAPPLTETPGSTPATAPGDSSRAGLKPLAAGEVARINALLKQFAEILGGAQSPREMRRLFPGFTPAHAQAFQQLHRAFGPGMQATLGRVEPRQVLGDTVRLRFVLLVRSDARAATPVPFDAAVARSSGDWVFTELRRAPGRGRSPR